MTATTTYRVGIDVGGTFTDFVLARSDGAMTLLKTPTTLDDQSRGALAGLATLADGEGRSLAELLGATEVVVHGTTTADNTMIEMNGAVTGLLTTDGHRDEIDIRRGFKEEIWDPAYPPPVPIAPRRRRLGVPERLDFRGDVVRALDEDAARTAILHITGQDELLEREPVIARAIDARNPWTDVLNLAQVELLRRAREGADDVGADGLGHAIHASVNAIAAAMQSTG